MSVLQEEFNVVSNVSVLDVKIKKIVLKQNKMKFLRKKDVIVKNHFVEKSIVNVLIEVNSVLMNAIAWIAKINHQIINAGNIQNKCKIKRNKEKYYKTLILIACINMNKVNKIKIPNK